MKKQEELGRELAELMEATKAGKVRWSLEVQTTEANEPSQKPKEIEDGVEWVIDECYVSYYCSYKGKEFCMITYEMLRTAGNQTASTNMVFCPPLGIRVFDLGVLLPYSVQAQAVLLNQIHQLWVLLMDCYKADKGSLSLNVHPGILIIED